MAEWEDKIERMQADGRITTHDADEVRNFAGFLESVQGVPSTGGTTEDIWKRRIAYAQHYPDDFETSHPDLYVATVDYMREHGIEF